MEEIRSVENRLAFFGVSASVPDMLQIYYLYLQKVRRKNKSNNRL